MPGAGIYNIKQRNIWPLLDAIIVTLFKWKCFLHILEFRRDDKQD